MLLLYYYDYMERLRFGIDFELHFGDVCYFTVDREWQMGFHEPLRYWPGTSSEETDTLA